MNETEAQRESVGEGGKIEMHDHTMLIKATWQLFHLKREYENITKKMKVMILELDVEIKERAS